jgi:predicted metal-dependent HD superfamily phosphohydrolase
VSLAARWAALFGPEAPAEAVDATGSELIARWSEPQRHYHTLEHLTRMLDVVDASPDYPDDYDAVRLACWFHDAIYDPARGDNEERSAELAASRLTPLGVDPAETARLVLLTGTHDVAHGDRNGELIADADLAILAADEPAYATYARQVRTEYAFVPEADFAAGRATILRRFLQRPVIYHLHPEWEPRARANVTAEIDALAAVARSETASQRCRGC